VGKPEVYKLLGRPVHKLVDDNNNDMDLVEIAWGCLYWIGLARNRKHWRALVDTEMNPWVS
jgi:hypothetical protein